MNGLLIHVLKAYGIIDKDNTINARYSKKLVSHPYILQQIVQTTQFLRYNAPIIARIHCILHNISYQPTCKVCGQATKMRLTGRQRFTFPTYCCSGCAAKDRDVLQKRYSTCEQRYGCKYAIHRS